MKHYTLIVILFIGILSSFFTTVVELIPASYFIPLKTIKFEKYSIISKVNIKYKGLYKVFFTVSRGDHFCSRLFIKDFKSPKIYKIDFTHYMHKKCFTILKDEKNDDNINILYGVSRHFFGLEKINVEKIVFINDKRK